MDLLKPSLDRRLFSISDHAVLSAGLIVIFGLVALGVTLGEGQLPYGVVLLPPLAAAAIATPRTVLVLGVAATVGAITWGALTSDLFTGFHTVRVVVVAIGSALAILLAGFQQQRAEERLSAVEAQARTQVAVAAQQRLDAALSAGQMGTWTWISERDEVIWDERLEALYGLRSGEFDQTLSMYLRLIHPDDRDAVMRIVQDALAKQSVYVTEHRCVWPDGTTHWVQGRGEVLRERGRVIGTTGVVADITERKQQEFERDRSRRLLDRILQDDRLLNPDVPGEEIPRLAAAMATELLECGFATYWTLDGPALVAGEGGPTTAGTKLSLEEHPEMQQTLRRKQIYRPGESDQLSSDRIFVPVIVAGELVGLLDLECDESELQRDETLRMVAARLSDQLGGALALYQHRQIQLRVHELSERLQQGLVPNLEVRTDAVEAASWYRPGEHRMIVGGDFVDVMTRDDGSLVFVIGDVSGHGPEAAALGATMRGAWAGLAVSGANPHEWVSGLHALVAKMASPGTFVTALVGIVSAGGERILLTNAGHPAPLFIDSKGAHTPKGGGTALGLIDEPADPFDLALTPTGPWRLLLYTDGLIEGRCDPDSPDRLGAQALAAHALQDASLRVPLHPWLDDLANLAVTRNGGPLPDDVAMLGLGTPSV